jgi:hypothetical protein
MTSVSHEVMRSAYVRLIWLHDVCPLYHTRHARISGTSSFNDKRHIRSDPRKLHTKERPFCFVEGTAKIETQCMDEDGDWDWDGALRLWPSYLPTSQHKKP